MLINCLSSSKKIILHRQKKTKQRSLFIDTRKPTLCNAKIKTGVKNQIIPEQPNCKAKIRQLWQNNLSMVNQPLILQIKHWVLMMVNRA